MQADSVSAGDYLGLDVGSSHVAAALLRLPEKKVLALKSECVSANLPPQREGERQQDTHVLLATTRQMLEKIRTPKLRAIGLTGQMHGIVYLDKTYRPRSGLFSWQDSRGDWIEGPRPPLLEQVSNGYGLLTHWVNRKLGLVPSDARWMVDAATSIGLQLVADKRRPVLHPSMAASFGGYDYGENDFERPAIRMHGLDEQLLPPVEPLGILGYDAHGVPLSAALGDNQAGVLAALGMTPNPQCIPSDQTVLVSFGTSAQVSCIGGYRLAIPSGGVIEQRPFLDQARLFAGSALCGGSAYGLLAEFVDDLWRQFSTFLQHRADPPPPMPSQAEVFSFLNQLDVPEEGDLPVFNPLFLGQRKCPELRAQLSGLGTDNFRIAFLKEALLRGMVAELQGYYQQLCALHVRNDRRLVGMGNGLRRNVRLQQLLSQHFDLPLKLMEQHEEAAIGAALYGARSFACGQGLAGA